MTKLRTFISILCLAVLLLVSAVSASGPVSAADGSMTLRASTSAGGSPFAQAGDVPDTSSGVGQPSWMGSIVLLFGGLIGGLWFAAGILTVLRGLGDARPQAEPEELHPFSNRTKDEAPPADWI